MWFLLFFYFERSYVVLLAILLSPRVCVTSFYLVPAEKPDFGVLLTKRIFYHAWRMRAYACFATRIYGLRELNDYFFLNKWEKNNYKGVVEFCC
jgi:hypothetical protein